MTEVALAFSNIDKPRADALARILNAVGYEVAAQPLTPEKVDRASAVLAFWSPSSINSQPVQSFASQAAFAKKLVSVRAGPADPPAAFALVTLHDLSSWTGSLDAPELRTLVSHVAKMAPPPSQQQQQQQRNVGFAGNGFDPYGAQAPTPAPREAAPAARDAAPYRDAALTPVSARGRTPPAPDRDAEEPRRAAGGGVARMAFGAIAVSVLGGAAVAAFNYEGGSDTATSPADAEVGAKLLTAAPDPDVGTQIAVAPSTVDGGVTGQVATEPEAPVQVAANTFSASSAAVAAPTAPAPASTVAAQPRNGWTASLPTTPPRPAAKTVPAASPTTARAQQPGRLPPIAGARPQPTDLVAIDGGANLAPDGDVKPAPAAPPPRVWQREGVTYGPDN